MSEENLKKTNNSLLELNSELEINAPYYFGYDICDKLISKLNEYNFDKLFLITDSTVYNLYGKELQHQLESTFLCDLVLSAEGESYKNINTLSDLCEKLISKGVSKRSVLLAFGGGVIGNIVGLTAALIYRGIRFVEIPTTTLAQTDSVLSNKQAINGYSGKNHFGVYHAPIFIWSDVRFLLSESPRRIKSGLVESVKNGFISDRNFLDYLDKYLNKKAIFSAEMLKDLVYKSILSKIDIIRKDPSEKKYGIVLEYGHTFGHAIEKLSNGTMTHGAAIAIGMTIAAEISNRLGYLSRSGVEQHYHFLKRKMELSLKIPSCIKAKEIIEVIKSDNKKSSKEVRYVLLEEIGKILNPDGDYMVSIDSKIVRDVIQGFVTS